MSNNKIKDKSKDHDYYFQTPHIVLHRCETPQEYTLWSVIKMVAGETGECYLSTPRLAAMAMMSSGACSTARKGLFDKGLIVGEFRQDPGWPQPVWHITIPDLWEENIKWRKANNSLIERIDQKEAQRNALKAKRKQTRDKKASQSDSVHNMKASYIDGGITNIDGGITYIETKNNQKNNQKGKPAHTPPISKNKKASSPNSKAYHINGNSKTSKNGAREFTDHDDGADIANQVTNKQKFVSAFSSAIRMPNPVERRKISEIGGEPGSDLARWQLSVEECGINYTGRKVTVAIVEEVYRAGGTWAARIDKLNREAEKAQERKPLTQAEIDEKIRQSVIKNQREMARIRELTGVSDEREDWTA